MLKTVKLYGDLGRKYGRIHRLDCRDAHDAIRAFCAMKPGFREHFTKGRFIVRVNGSPIGTKEELGLPGNTFHFIPVIEGASHGLGEVFLGVGLVVASYMVLGPGGAAVNSGFLSAGVASTAGSIVTAMGVTMVLAGVGNALMKPLPWMFPNTQNSFAFNGPTNSVQQGQPVPVLYGTLLIGSEVISAAVRSYDVPIGQTPAGQTTQTSWKTGQMLTYTSNTSAYLGGS
ncbi:MAG: hypothetical protein GJU67_01925 [Ferrovum sp.]|jgi:predicted phage tail protein|nr:hypothetical protein [Ferrovum sp.]